MIVEEFTFELKNGKKALVRSPREEDIEGMLDYLYVTSGETEFLLRYPEECTKYTREGEKALFERVNAADNEAMLVCFVDGKIAGNSHIVWSKGLKTRHRAQVAIALCRAYWGQGIGTRLMQAMTDIAMRNEHLLQMELDFIEGNSRARALYEKMGFRITGVKPDAIRLKDGRLLCEYSMVKKIRG